MLDEPMNGRVSIFKGEIFYSPNSSRDLVLPRGTSENTPRDAPPLNAREFQNPRWWAAPTEWLAFIPRLPVAFNGVLFEALAYVPQEIALTAPYGYILSGNILPLWLSIEDTLNNVITSLCALNKLRPKLPFPPRQFGYSKMHETERKAMVAMTESRDWFSLWIGLLFWAMHKTADSEDEVEGTGGPPRWFIELSKIHWNQGLLDSLFTEPLLQKHSSTDRVGVVLHFPDDHQSRQPPATWFISLGIPIWYRWGAREAEAAEVQQNFSLPAPPISQLQEATTLLGFSRHLPPPETQPPQEEQARNDPSDPPTRDHSAKAVLQAFFRRRAARKRTRLRRRQARLEEGEVVEDTPTSPTAVYVWDWDPEDPTLFTRMHVPRDEGEETLAKYASYQKRYDASCNEWDCCRLWDPEADENARNEEEKDSQCRSPCSRGPPNLDTRAELDDCMQQTPTTLDVTLDGTAATKIFDLLRLHYGFVSPLPFPDTLAISSSLNTSGRNQDLLLHTLGLASIPSGSSLLQKPLFQFYTQFIQKFIAKQPQKPNDDEWDLSPSNRHTLTSCSRLRNVRLVTGKYDSNFRMYMFDFGSEATAPWKLAVYSSATVLYICRLVEEMRDKDIVLALVQSGFPFRTFQPVDSFSDVLEAGPLADSALLPIRVRGDSFSLGDWHNYEAQQRLVLAQPRCGRAALRRGGFVCRIARDMVDMNEALAGPSGRYANPDLNFSVLDDQGIEYVDDDLTSSELDVLMGHHLTSTDQGTWKNKRIWYGGRDLFAWAWWTERLERFYQTRVEVALRDEKSREPHVPRLRPSQREQTAQKRLEAWSDEFLTKQLGLPTQLE